MVVNFDIMKQMQNFPFAARSKRPRPKNRRHYGAGVPRPLRSSRVLQLPLTSMAVRSLVALFLASFPAVSSFALTVRTKSDLRLWETVTDRLRPLEWSWEGCADEAVLTFSNRLTRTVKSVAVAREAGASRGACDHPVASVTDEALIVATLVQKAGGVEIAHETAELAYVPGAGGAITVRPKAGREWTRVRKPRVAAYDARWWEVAGPSGYEVLWAELAGPHRVVREFEGAGVVDEAVLTFGIPGFLLLLR